MLTKSLVFSDFFRSIILSRLLQPAVAKFRRHMQLTDLRRLQRSSSPASHENCCFQPRQLHASRGKAYRSPVAVSALDNWHALLADVAHNHHGLHHISLPESSGGLFGLTQDLDSVVQQQLNGVSPVTFAVVFGAGLLTSLSPCTLSVLPLTIGYIGGYSDAGTKAEGSPFVGRAAAFAFGLATTLALLGVGSSLLGKTYGQIGGGLPIAVSIVAILMGLNLLNVVKLRLPSVDIDVRKFSAPPLLQAYAAGLTFALVASPCSTPILATLLAFVSQTQDPVLGGSLLLAYTTGYVGPLLVAATFAGALKQVMALRQWSGWITPASGVLLLAGGTYGLLSRTVPG